MNNIRFIETLIENFKNYISIGETELKIYTDLGDDEESDRTKNNLDYLKERLNILEQIKKELDRLEQLKTENQELREIIKANFFYHEHSEEIGYRSVPIPKYQEKIKKVLEDE